MIRLVSRKETGEEKQRQGKGEREREREGKKRTGCHHLSICVLNGTSRTKHREEER